MADLQDMQEAAVVKGGVTMTNVILHRTKMGLHVEVHTHPDVEDFMAHLAGGEKLPVGLVGRYWTPFPMKEPPLPLDAYGLKHKLDLRPTEDGMMYTIDKLGQPLYEQGMISISMLRLVGTSDPSGVIFGVKGVFSHGMLKEMRDRIVRASRRFYIDFMQPMDVSAVVYKNERGQYEMSTQELHF